MNNSECLVSVIIPVYRVEKYLRDSVSGIINQTYRNLEIILVDDGSDDNCPKICDELAGKDERIIALHKPNGGLSDARNYGLKYATGKYIYFFDSDDFLEKEAIEKLVSTAEETKAGAVAFGFKRVDESGKILEDKHFKERRYSFDSEDEKVNFICRTLCFYEVGWEAWNRLYRADVIKDNSLKYEPNKEVFSEDWCFNIYYTLCTNDIVVIDDTFYHYLIRGDSIMGRTPEPRFNELLNFMEFVEKFAKDRGLGKISKKCRYINVALIYRLLIKIKPNEYKKYHDNWKCTDIDHKFGSLLQRPFIFAGSIGLKSGLRCFVLFEMFIHS